MKAVAHTLRRPAELAAAGLVAPEATPELDRVAERYAVAITPAMAALIDPTDPADPIARQFLPDPAELREHPAERADPIDDAGHSPMPGLVHRYPDRVLLKAVHTCPVYCRYCFRREMVGPGRSDGLSAEDFERITAYVAARPEIREVIVTGGDPFVLSPRRIAGLTEAFAALPHVRTIRWHTRVPVVAPDLVTDELAAALRRDGIATWVAIHADHPREFTAAAREACARLADAGVPLVSQSVLLAGVNDDAETLAELMRVFVENRIKPYYLHHPDLAPGTAHFRTDPAVGRALMRELWRRVSGLARPVYVLDMPDGAGKVPIGPSHLDAAEDGGWIVETVRGDHAPYDPGLPPRRGPSTAS